VACRASSDKKALLRIVRDSDGVVRLDPTGKAPGRGAYLCPTSECIQTAFKQKRLDRALRTQTPPTVAEDLERALRISGDNEN
jgi:uncharacterized protein